MPLTRASDRFVMRQENLHFLMKDGEAEVVCAIPASVLLAIGQAAGMSNPVFAFWAFREKIETAASAKFDRTVRVDYEVWPAPGSEDTELGVFMGPEVRHGTTKVYPGIQA
jgi:hypothetical protein